MKERYMILDCYVDEPACLGVPPFISPYPRYLFGALIDAGVPGENIEYITIDTLRSNQYIIQRLYSMAFMIGGAVVPGKYLGARIGTLAEAGKILSGNPRQKFAVGGMIKNILPRRYDNAILLNHDIEKFSHEFAAGTPLDAPRSVQEIARWSVHGAEVVRSHPGFPNIICEIETSRGCPRDSHCSFCVEGLFNKIEFRDEADIISEIESLIKNGVSRFRIGRQADILQYKPDFSIKKSGFPKPETAPIKKLFSYLKEQREKGRIKTLNIDNANPGTIANFPFESEEILEIIAAAITPGDTLALGIESFDPVVAALNNLKVDAPMAIEAVRLINRIGGRRVNGVPILLPGINLIHGLTGETMDTFKINYESLRKIINDGLLIKRINIRKVLPHPGTPLYERHKTISKKIQNRFEHFREKIRNDIDNFMLKEIYPSGTILRDVQMLEIHGDYSYGKQIASYSIAVKHPLKLNINEFYDSIVIGHRERSLIGIPCPVEINRLPLKAIELIPGIGKKGASQIIMKRPFKNKEALQPVLDNLTSRIKDTILDSIIFN